ncbi:MAG: superoxide dismutase family protein [Acidobacteriota bacterium]
MTNVGGMMKKFLFALGTAVLISGCASKMSSSAAGPVAVATLEAKSGSTAHGTVRFAEAADGQVTVSLDLTNVPAGSHGFHVHEKGDCSSADASSAGGHFAPMGNQHGAPTAAQHHAGDFGNITVAADGNVKTSFVTRSVTVSPGPTSVVGKAVILHEKADDLVSQPSGNAGARISCGVINLLGM